MWNMIKRIYIDTSVVGGFFDRVFEADTKALLERFRVCYFKHFGTEIEKCAKTGT